MPQLIIVALVGGAIWYGYRAFKREMDRVAQETREAELKRQPATRLEKTRTVSTGPQRMVANSPDCCSGLLVPARG